MSLSDDDFRLSMRTSPKPRVERFAGLRSLIVHRLHNSLKGIYRIGLRAENQSMHCEPCGRWHPLDDGPPPVEWTCPSCRRTYAMEYGIYAEVDE